MNEKEVKAHLEWLLNNGILSSEDEESVKTALQLLEQKDNKINKVIDKLKEDIGIGQKELKTEEWYTKKYAVFESCIEYAKEILKILEE